MVLTLTLVFPLALLALPLLMERVEQPLRSAPPLGVPPTSAPIGPSDGLERPVQEGYAPAVERRRRRALLRLRRRPD